MSTFFVPYSDDVPAAVDIKGHRLLIVASDADDIAHDLGIVGAQEVREVSLTGDETEALVNLAASVNGGVVVTPPGVSPSDMIENLEQELPWVH